MSQSKRYQDEDWLREQYWVKDKTQKEIADECDVSRSLITHWMQEKDIESNYGERYPDAKFRDEDWLRRKYWDEEKSISQIAEECDVSGSAIRTWLKNHDIETRTEGRKCPDTRLRDAEWLEQKYWGEGLSLREIADECGTCGSPTVLRWMQKHDIETRTSAIDKPPAHVLQDNYGYEVIRCEIYGIKRKIGVHRLVAVAEYGFDAVCDMVVHHKNGFKIDNRPENLDLMTRAEHASHHHGGNDG